MEKKKMKIWKKILIVIAVIILIYLLITLYKFSVLTKIYEKGKASNEIPNRYYYSETEDQIIKCWQKDGIKKMSAKRKEKIGDIEMWENSNTGEKYVFWNEPEKMYQEGGQVVIGIASMFSEGESKYRIMMAINPALVIYPKKYDDKQCYGIKMSTISEVVDKETGLVLYVNNGSERTYSYTFNEVTDEDVQMPNLSEYKYIGSND